MILGLTIKMKERMQIFVFKKRFFYFFTEPMLDDFTELMMEINF